MLKIGINGFGRIGRSFLRASFRRWPDCHVVAINDPAPVESLAYLLKYDSNYGKFPNVSWEANNLIVGSHTIPVLNATDPRKIPWRDAGVDLVIESSGFFTEAALAQGHIDAGAKKVIISAVAKKNSAPQYILGVNDDNLATENSPIISNGSCTTNCSAPVSAVLEQALGIEAGMLTTVHSYTATQALVDSPRADLRDGRAAAQNMVPSETGAALATALVVPALKDRFDGLAIRVPTATVSLCDLTYYVKRNTTVNELKHFFVTASKTQTMQGILGVTSEPLVSLDFKGDPRSAIVDLNLIKVVGGRMVKIVAWYDNEWGYANRLAELAHKFGLGL